MRAKPATCGACPLAESGRGFVRPARFPEHPVLLVQGEAPGAGEAAQGEPFAGRAGYWLRKNLLAVAGVDPEAVVFDNTLRCLPPTLGNGAAYPNASSRAAAERACRVYDVWDRWPSVPLLLLGGNAARQRLGVGPISAWHGHIEERGERWVGITFHPAAVMRNPNLLPVVVAEIRHLLRRARGEETVAEVWIGRGDALRAAPFVCDLEWDANRAVTVVGTAQSGTETHVSWHVEAGLERVRRAMAEGACVVGHNIIAADMPFLGEPLSYEPQHVWDTMVAAHLVHPHLAGSGGDGDGGVGLLGLGDLCRMVLGVPEWKQDRTDLLAYNAKDCAYNYRLYEVLRRDLRATRQEHLLGKQQKLAYLARLMHARGVRVDSAGVEAMVSTQGERRARLSARLPFNPRSPQQVRAWLDAHGVRLANTSEATLRKAALAHPELRAAWEPLLALKSDWKPLDTWFSPAARRAGCVHPKFHVTGTAVGRFSSSGPNLQNVPPGLRRWLLPPPGAQWAALDYSQIENRMIAWLADDQAALADYRSGLDMHRLTAARIYGKRVEDVSREERHTAKTVVHATGYLETAVHLAERLWGARTQAAVRRAQELQDAYLNAYPAIRAWHRRLGARLEAGRVQLTNPFGRVRCVYAQNAHERLKRAAHFLACSAAADLMGERMLAIHQELGLVPHLVVHDELVYAVPMGAAGRAVAERCAAIMSRPAAVLPGLVFPVAAALGANYGKQDADNPEGLA